MAAAGVLPKVPGFSGVGAAGSGVGVRVRGRGQGSGSGSGSGVGVRGQGQGSGSGVAGPGGVRGVSCRGSLTSLRQVCTHNTRARVRGVKFPDEARCRVCLRDLEAWVVGGVRARATIVAVIVAALREGRPDMPLPAAQLEAEARPSCCGSRKPVGRCRPTFPGRPRATGPILAKDTGAEGAGKRRTFRRPRAIGQRVRPIFAIFASIAGSIASAWRKCCSARSSLPSCR